MPRKMIIMMTGDQRPQSLARGVYRWLSLGLSVSFWLCGIVSVCFEKRINLVDFTKSLSELMMSRGGVVTNAAAAAASAGGRVIKGRGGDEERNSGGVRNVH